MKNKILATILLIVFIVSINVSIIFATTETDELKSQQNEIEEKISEAEEKQEEVGEQITEATKQIQQLTSQISEYESQIDDLDEQLEELEASIEETQEQLEEAEEKYNEQQEILQNRIVAQYEAGETTYLDVILGGGSLWDMVSNWYMVSEIAEKDNELLEQIEANKQQIEEAKTALETSSQQVQTLKSSKEKTAEALKASQAEKEEQVSQLNEEEQLLQEEIDELNEQNAEVEEQLAEAERKYQEQIKKLSSGSVTVSNSSETISLGGSGVLQRPVKSGTITAGMYYSSGLYHGALDYGVSVGTTVYAAADGVVLAAGWRSGGLGYCVVIQHENGLRTYYGHGNGTFYVSEGATVAKGQAIMLSGNSGNSTGAHLHFEVRVSPYSWVYGGGSGDCRVDPRNYM